MQQEVHSIELHVEQNQIDLWECLKFHHPSSSDDKDDAPMANASWLSSLVIVFDVFWDIFILFIFCWNSWIFYYSVYPSPSETFRGSDFWCVWFLLLCFTLCHFVTKMGNSLYLHRDCIFNRSSDFCPRMAKRGVCSFVISHILLDKITSL